MNPYSMIKTTSISRNRVYLYLRHTYIIVKTLFIPHHPPLFTSSELYVLYMHHNTNTTLLDMEVYVTNAVRTVRVVYVFAFHLCTCICAFYVSCTPLRAVLLRLTQRLINTPNLCNNKLQVSYINKILTNPLCKRH